MGYLYLVVLNPYQVNETVANNMDINVFFALDDDFELSCPAGNISLFNVNPFASDDDEKLEHHTPYDRLSSVPHMMRTGALGGESLSNEVKDVDARPLGGGRIESLSNDGPDAIFNRQFYLTAIQWPVSAVVGTVLYSARVPFGMIPAGPFTNIFDSFVYKRFRFQIYLEIQSNAFQQGQIVAFFVPFGITATQGSSPVTTTLSQAEQTLGPHVLLKAGHNTSGTLEMPFLHPLNALDAIEASTERGTLCTFVIAVFNKMEIGASAPSASQNIPIAISVKMDEMELSIPDPALTPPLLSQQALTFCDDWLVTQENIPHPKNVRRPQ